MTHAPFAGFLRHLYGNINSHEPLLRERRRIDRAASVCAIFRVALPEGQTPPDNLDQMINSSWLRTVEPELLYVKRAVNPRDRWSGNVAFPGGKQDPGETALDTAIREAQEEVGLDLRKDFWLMGRMDDRTTNGRFRGPNMVVSMFVFVQIPGRNPKITLQTTELADARWLPLSTYNNPQKAAHIVTYSSLLQFVIFGRLLAKGLSLLGLEAVEFPAVRFPPPPPRPDSNEPVWDYKLWGLTLGMTSELLAAGGHQGVSLESNSWITNLFYEIRTPSWRRKGPVESPWHARYRMAMVALLLTVVAWLVRQNVGGVVAWLFAPQQCDHCHH